MRRLGAKKQSHNHKYSSHKDDLLDGISDVSCNSS